MKLRRLLPVAMLLALASPCLAQGKPAAKPAEQPAGDKPAAQPAPAWPAKVQKKLYGADFRGKKAPDFVVEETLTSKPDREGKIVLIDFWATWCGPCREALPEIDAFQKKFKDDLVCIGVSDEKPATVKSFLAKNKTSYTQAIDTKARMKKALKVEGIPHVIIISTDGVVRWQGFPFSGEDRLTADVIEKIIKADPGVQARRKGGKPKGSEPQKPAEKGAGKSGGGG